MEQAAATPVGSLAASLVGRFFELQGYALKAGPTEFHPHLGYQFQYGDGIQNIPGSEEATGLNTISPGLAWQIGKNWFADFTLGINVYTNPDFENYVGYNFSLGGQIPFEEWTVRLGYTGSLSDEPQLETGTQTEQLTHRLVASGSRRFGRYSLDLSASQTTQLTDQFNNQWTWSTMTWLNYQATPKTSVGFGLGAGYNLIDPGTDSVNQQIQGRVSWAPGRKLSFQLSGGAQIQEFLNAEVDVGVFPIFSLAVVYQPVEPTSISLNASHTVGNSLFLDQFTQTTAAGLGINQRLLRHFNLSISANYNFTKYQSIGGDFAVNREDKYPSVYASLGTTLFKKLGTSIFYQYTADHSTDSAYSTGGSIVGLNLNYRY